MRLFNTWPSTLKDLFRGNLLWNNFLGPLGDAKIEKKLDPNPLGGPRLCCQSLVRSASLCPHLRYPCDILAISFSHPSVILPH